jgi:hypothetical protein
MLFVSFLNNVITTLNSRVLLKQMLLGYDDDDDDVLLCVDEVDNKVKKCEILFYFIYLFIYFLC